MRSIARLGFTALAVCLAAADDSGSVPAQSGPKSGNNPDGRQTITIQGFEFEIPAPYAAGHQLTDNEASAFNQLFAENVRNNSAGGIKAATEAATEAGNPITQESLGDFKIGEGDTAKSILDTVSDYAENYEFGARRTRTASEPVDPVQREAHRIAVDAVRQALKDKGIKQKSLPEGKFDEMVKKFAATDGVQKEAKRRANAASKIGLDELGIETPTAEAPAEGEVEAPAESA